MSTSHYVPDITLHEHTISVRSHYLSSFVERARALGGEYRDGLWSFDKQFETQVREACEQHFGYDGLSTPVLVDVDVVFNHTLSADPYQSIDLFGRPLVRMTQHSDSPLLAKGLLLHSGSITGHDGIAMIARDTRLTLTQIPVGLIVGQGASQDYQLKVRPPSDPTLEFLFYEQAHHLRRLQEIAALFKYAEIDYEGFSQHMKVRELQRISPERVDL